MMRAFLAALLAGVSALAPSTASAAVQIISFEGVLDYGSNWGVSPFGATGTQLGGKTYKVVMSYDPTLFENQGTCGSVPSNQCNFTFTAARPMTGTFTVGDITQEYTWTDGEFYLSAGGNDQFGFNFNAPVGSFSGSFGDTDLFYPDQTSVNTPIFANFSNLAVTHGTFQFNPNGFGFGDAPGALSASYTPSVIQPTAAVPEPETWAMMILGIAMMGGVMRTRRRQQPGICFAT